MEEWNPFKISQMEKEVLDIYIKYGYGPFKMYQTSFFMTSLTDETAMLTLQEFADRCEVNE